MNWYGLIKMALPLAPSRGTYFSIGHGGGNSQMWYIDESWQMHTQPVKVQDDNHMDWDEFMSADLIARGRYEGDTEKASVFIHSRNPNDVDKVLKMVDAYFNSPAIQLEPTPGYQSPFEEEPYSEWH